MTRSLLFLAAGLLTAVRVPAADQLPLAPEQICPLAIGATAPAPVLTAADGSAFDLARAFAEKPTIVIFYRGGWCPFCNRHLAALADVELELRALGFQLIGITPDTPDKLTPTAKENGVRYRLLSDRAMRASGAFHVAFRLSPETGKGYRENGIDLPAAPDGNGFWQPVPAAFIVARDGKIRFVYSNPDPENSVAVADLLAAARIAAR
jgi:peroxiredoxin